MASKKKAPTKVRSDAENFVDYERRKYAREWEVSASHFEQTGRYRWMGDRMNVSGLVLEVGCGTGASTLELARRGNKVIAVEENPACIRRARTLLEESGIETNVVLRGSVAPLDSRRHRITYNKVGKPAVGTVLLIEGNVLSDPQLMDFLADLRPFDAIVCWLIGVHRAMAMNAAIDVNEIRTASDYRLLVQNEVYERADELLRVGGTLHIVDRVVNLSQLVLDDTRRSHEEQARITSLVVSDIESVPYTEAVAQGSVGMVQVMPDNSHVPAKGDFALVSIGSVKRRSA